METQTPPQPMDPMTETALRSLHDIAIPQPVSWVPQTWGWALIAIAVALVAMLLALRWLRHYRANAYRREAVAMLGGIDAGLRNGMPPREAAHQLGELLKRTALAAWPRKKVASLSGRAWVDFLSGDDKETDDSALRRLFDDLEYQDRLPTVQFLNEVIPAARRWIERHHVRA